MAILDLVPEIEVTVSVNKVPLPEYPDDEADALSSDRARRTVSKYIESVTDAQFRVDYSIKPQYKYDSPCLSFDVYVDGVRVRSKLAHSRNSQTFSVDGVCIADSLGKPVIKPFMFSKIATSCDELNRSTIEEESKNMSKIGIIVVEVHRRSERRPVPFRGSGGSLLAPSEVHEKAMKGDAKSHGVSLGPERRVSARKHYKTHRLDDLPLAIYQFKYRSKDALKQLLVIERTPDPDATQNSSALDDLNPEQRREAERYIEQLKKGRGIKRERDDEGGASRKKVCKSEEEIMTVDLTGGD